MNKPSSFDESMAMAGGFGKFQFFALAVLISAFCTGGNIVYGLGYLTIYPQYLCKSGENWQHCERADFCNSKLPPS